MKIEEQVIELKKKIDKLEKRVSCLEGSKYNNNFSPKKLSVGEFLINKKPKNDVDMTLCICYYLETYENINIFNKKDIEREFMKAKQKIPENINYKIYRNIKNGHLMEINEKKDNLKTWTLTNSGIKYVEEKLK